MTVKVAAPGLHCWPHPLAVVQYLGAPHRHLFVFRVTWEVLHDERDVEFHIAQSWVREALTRLWGEAPHEFGGRSCETIARELGSGLPGRVAAVECSEDDENSATVEFS